MKQGFIIRLAEAIISVMPNCDFDWTFVNKNQRKIIAERMQLPYEDETDFRIRLNSEAEEFREAAKK